MADDKTPWVRIATASAECPACLEHIPVEIHGRTFTDVQGRHSMETRPDLADLWAHTWKHEGQPEEVPDVAG